nr:uncharacterized protein C21orf62 homolog isoform X4 [Rattus norvegicus]
MPSWWWKLVVCYHIPKALPVSHRMLGQIQNADKKSMKEAENSPREAQMGVDTEEGAQAKPEWYNSWRLGHEKLQLFLPN